MIDTRYDNLYSSLKLYELGLLITEAKKDIDIIPVYMLASCRFLQKITRLYGTALHLSLTCACFADKLE